MAKIKLNIKNTQIAEAIKLGGLKERLAKKKAEDNSEKKEPKPKKTVGKSPTVTPDEPIKEEGPRIRARSKSVFAEPPPISSEVKAEETEQPSILSEKDKADEEPVKEFLNEPSSSSVEQIETLYVEEIPEIVLPEVVSPAAAIRGSEKSGVESTPDVSSSLPATAPASKDKLGPTGRHVKDLFKAKPLPPAPVAETSVSAEAEEKKSKGKKVKPLETAAAAETESDALKKGLKTAKYKEFRDVKPTARKQEGVRSFDARDRLGLRDVEEDQQWRKRRMNKPSRPKYEEIPVRPTSLKIRIPISIKDLAVEMKLKASQLISKLFLQGVVATLNDLLEDEMTIQLLGHEFGCDIKIDTTQERRIRITDKSIKEEIQQSPEDRLILRPPVVAFMGHVDHGKTSLIDAIRKSNRASGEAGAITQHIGAFRCQTPVGDLTVLDTPGHEAFSAMRARGADVTDIIVLVVAGDEGLRQQTLEAINHAKAAGVIIVVAINKSDKPAFNADNVYRQLAEVDLLPEAWGGKPSP